MRLFLRYVLPWLIARFVAKQQEKFQNMSGFQEDYNSNQEGDINIKSNRSNNKSDDSDFGEYVDFEEVDK